MENDPVLMAFNTRRVEQSETEESGLVMAANDHATRSCALWWAGPETAFLDRIKAEARSRGITLQVQRAHYSRQELERAVRLVFAGRRRLNQVGFDLQAIEAASQDFLGLTVKGTSVQHEAVEPLPPTLVASVHREVATLLTNSQVRPDDVRIEYGRVVLY